MVLGRKNYPLPFKVLLVGLIKLTQDRYTGDKNKLKFNNIHTSDIPRDPGTLSK